MERFFILDEFNTWYDWDLILTAKDVTPPEPKTNYVNIDGMDGTLDLSETLTGRITYDDRTVTASFWTDKGNHKTRAALLQKIIAALHGKKVKIIEPDDPEHYLYGRVKVKSSSNILPYMTFTIEAVCEPWRYSIDESVRSVTVNDNEVDLVINNYGEKTVCPVIKVDGYVTIVDNGSSAELTTGSYKIPSLKLNPGATVITVSGNGTVTLTYREADL